MDTRKPERCFAACAPGLERFVRAELLALGIRAPFDRTGGVEFQATTRQLYAMNVWSRIASRVLVRVSTFDASTFADLERGVERIGWSRYLPPGSGASFRVTTSKSAALYHSGAVTDRLTRILGEGEQLVVVRIGSDNRATMSVDSSGEHLHRRGWRLAVAKAPLRETLAAALLTAAGWDGSAPLLDPLCGSGTIPIEAALIARRRPPGLDRRFAFQGWPSFEPGTWASVIGAAKAGLAMSAGRLPLIRGSDRDPGAIEAATANAERAGVRDDVAFSVCSLSSAVPSAGAGWLVSNPPYGARVASAADRRNLFARYGAIARHEGEGRRVALLASDIGLARHCGVPLVEAFRTTNGGIAVLGLVSP